MILRIIKIIITGVILLFLIIELGKNYIDVLPKFDSVRVILIDYVNFKNRILMRDTNDKIALLESSGSCRYCDFREANFDGVNLSNKDLTGANLLGLDLSDLDLSGTNFNYANLSNGVLLRNNLEGTILTNANLSGANLDGIGLRAKRDLTGTILTYSSLINSNLAGVDLRNKDLTGANLSGVDLSNKDFSGTILINTNLSKTNLDGVDLRNKDLTGANLSGVDLSNKDFSGTILINTILSRTNLDGVDFSNKDLTGVNLDNVDQSNVNLTGVIWNNSSEEDVVINQTNQKFETVLKNPSNSNWMDFNETRNLNIIRYDLSGDTQYVATKEGFLFEYDNNEFKLVLDLNNEDTSFVSDGEKGLIGLASRNDLIYVSYSTMDRNGQFNLEVYEYSENFTKVRNIIKIDWKVLKEGESPTHFGGNLLFDSKGGLYLSVGDADVSKEAQNLNNLWGKILRLDLSKSKLDPEIIAYGIRSPWGGFIDSQDRMFVLQCGNNDVEALYLLNDLYPDNPINFGWPIFEGSVRKQQNLLSFNDVSAPIFETKKRGGCLTAGLYLEDIDAFLFGDYYGTIRIIKQQENQQWALLYDNYREGEYMWGFALDKKTNEIFIAPKHLQLEVLVTQ